MICANFARAYVSRGWPVFRIRYGTKQPVDAWVRGGADQRATLDSDEVDRRWSFIYNIGIATGHELPSGAFLTVLDLDTDEPGFAGRPEWAIPTYEVSTPSGGLHLYYATAEPLRSGRYAAGIDVKSRGGMVLAPPSVVNRRTYKVFRDCSDLPEIPVRLFSTVLKQGTDASPYGTDVHPLTQQRTNLKMPEEIQPGERNSQLMANAAAIYGEASTAEEARYAVETFNRLMPHPLSAREVKNITDWLEAREAWL